MYPSETQVLDISLPLSYICCRETLCSFSTTDVALSSTLFAISTGVNLSLYMDELSVLSQVILSSY